MTSSNSVNLKNKHKEVDESVEDKAISHEEEEERECRVSIYKV